MYSNSPPLQSELNLAALPTAAYWARRHALDVLVAWELIRFTETVELLVSELVTNALNASVGLHVPERHLEPVPPDIHELIRLRLAYERMRLRIEVWDGTDDGPVPGMAAVADEEAEGGRGLLLVQALSLDWGWNPDQDGGKVVWCEVGALRLAPPSPVGWEG